ncbi:PilZ domain-containing protein [Leptospira perolatii]|uniref:PilZ domain-containing protein n=1 Tax=Leptospira perolatii TaxID=2023191 RepID=A0A2M9ZQT4_9LEPT|nr:PilZ domain-containing protein [Leptospira perolatii]PJZ68368.1 PilZ domain-containing protein [Leptospira perolatii]PJZ74436.1 PilZ domain-containing protein [Leptospira perolatii]
MKYSRIPHTLNVGFQIMEESKFRFAENVLLGLVHRSEDPLEPGTNLAVKVGVLSLSGAIEVPMKVIKCQKVSEGEFDIYLNYTENDFSKIEKLEELIRDLA